jgi:F1F0 ATPase subunit 2
MSEPLTWALAWLAGAGIGAIFFGGLYWTVRKGAASRRAALWFLGSALLRMSFALAGFYVVSGGRWERLLLSLVGFVMARLVVTRLTGSPEPAPARPAREVRDAP